MEDYQKKKHILKISKSKIPNRSLLAGAFGKIRPRVHVPKRWYVSALARRVSKSAWASRSSGTWGRPDAAPNLAARDHREVDHYLCCQLYLNDIPTP